MNWIYVIGILQIILTSNSQSISPQRLHNIVTHKEGNQVPSTETFDACKQLIQQMKNTISIVSIDAVSKANIFESEKVEDTLLNNLDPEYDLLKKEWDVLELSWTIVMMSWMYHREKNSDGSSKIHFNAVKTNQEADPKIKTTTRDLKRMYKKDLTSIYSLPQEVETIWHDMRNKWSRKLEIYKRIAHIGDNIEKSEYSVKSWVDTHEKSMDLKKKIICLKEGWKITQKKYTEVKPKLKEEYQNLSKSQILCSIKQNDILVEVKNYGSMTVEITALFTEMNNMLEEIAVLRGNSNKIIHSLENMIQVAEKIELIRNSRIKSLIQMNVILYENFDDICSMWDHLQILLDHCITANLTHDKLREFMSINKTFIETGKISRKVSKGLPIERCVLWSAPMNIDNMKRTIITFKESKKTFDEITVFLQQNISELQNMIG